MTKRKGVTKRPVMKSLIENMTDQWSARWSKSQHSLAMTARPRCVGADDETIFALIYSLRISTASRKLIKSERPNTELHVA